MVTASQFDLVTTGNSYIFGVSLLARPLMRKRDLCTWSSKGGQDPTIGPPGKILTFIPVYLMV